MFGGAEGAHLGGNMSWRRRRQPSAMDSDQTRVELLHLYKASTQKKTNSFAARYSVIFYLIITLELEHEYFLQDNSLQMYKPRYSDKKSRRRREKKLGGARSAPIFFVDFR